MGALIRDRFAIGCVGVAVLLIGLGALLYPVELPTYDHWGVRIYCGTATGVDVAQAATHDTYVRTHPSAAHLPRDTVSECRRSVWLRRGWAIPTIVVGLTPLMVLASRPPKRTHTGGDRSTVSPHGQ